MMDNKQFRNFKLHLLGLIKLSRNRIYEKFPSG